MSSEEAEKVDLPRQPLLIFSDDSPHPDVRQNNKVHQVLLFKHSSTNPAVRDESQLRWSSSCN